MRYSVALLVCLPLMAGEVRAEEAAPPDRFALNLGGYYVEDSNTDLAVNSTSGGLGTSINFGRDLDTEKRTSGPRLNGYYRFNPRHRIDFGWLSLKREGRRRIDRSISFGNLSYTVGTDVDSTIDTELWKLLYTWSFYHQEKVELGVSLGAYLLDYSVTLSQPSGRSERASISQPLPVFGFRMDYAMTPRWHARLNLENFYIDVENNFQGSAYDVAAAVEYRATRNVILGVAADRLAFDATIDQSDWRGSMADLYRGFFGYVGVRF